MEPAQREGNLLLGATAIPTQEGMEHYLQTVAERARRNLPGTITAMMAPRLVECSWEEGWLLFSFDTPAFAANPGGIMHGGMVAAVMDVALGCIASYYNQGVMTPTIQLSLSYLRPVRLGPPLLVRAWRDACGRTMGYSHAAAWQEEESRPAATAQGVYYNAGRG